MAAVPTGAVLLSGFDSGTAAPPGIGPPTGPSGSARIVRVAAPATWLVNSQNSCEFKLAASLAGRKVRIHRPD